MEEQQKIAIYSIYQISLRISIPIIYIQKKSYQLLEDLQCKEKPELGIILKNKMSIEYQLYQMATINQIIIPTCSNCSLPPPLPHTPTPYFLTTPKKQQSIHHNLPWKKTHSAFKKFREKRDKKITENAPEAFQQQNVPSQVPSRRYKLTVQHPSIKQIQQFYQNYFQCQPPYGYYDPNLAPLHRYPPSDCPLPDLPVVDYSQKKKLPKASIKKQEEQPQIRSLKIQPLPYKKQEEVSSDQIIMIAQDDPFIIIRRESLNKSNKSFKTKYIKKQKIYKETTPSHHHRINSILRLDLDKTMNCQEVIPEGQISLKNGFTPPITIRREQQPLSRPSLDVIQIESSSSEVLKSEQDESWKQQQIIECD